MALPDGGMEKVVVLLRFNIVALEPPETPSVWIHIPFSTCDVISFNGQGTCAG